MDLWYHLFVVGGALVVLSSIPLAPAEMETLRIDIRKAPVGVKP